MAGRAACRRAMLSPRATRGRTSSPMSSSRRKGDRRSPRPTPSPARSPGPAQRLMSSRRRPARWRSPAPLSPRRGWPRGGHRGQLGDPYGNPLAVSAGDQTIGLSTTSSAGTSMRARPAPRPSRASWSRPEPAPSPSTTATPRPAPRRSAASDPALSSALPKTRRSSRRRPDHFTVTTSFTSPDVAGTVGTVTITAYDAYNNRVGSGPDQYEGTVDLTSSDGQTAGLPATYTFTARRRRFAHLHECGAEDGGEPVDHRDRLRSAAQSRATCRSP